MGICLIQMPAAIKCCSKKSDSLPLEESNVEEEQMSCHAKNIMKKLKVGRNPWENHKLMLLFMHVVYTNV